MCYTSIANSWDKLHETSVAIGNVFNKNGIRHYKINEYLTDINTHICAYDSKISL